MAALNRGIWPCEGPDFKRISGERVDGLISISESAKRSKAKKSGQATCGHVKLALWAHAPTGN